MAPPHPFREPERRVGLRRSLTLLLVMWGSCLVAIVAVASETKIGPVLFALDDRHGVHLGDVAAAAVCVAVALVITSELLARRRATFAGRCR